MLSVYLGVLSMSSRLAQRSVFSGALVLLLLAPASVAADAGPWSQFHGTARHAGLGQVAGPRQLTFAWYAPSLGDVDGSPAVAADGSIYFASSDGTVHGLSSEGGQRWAYNSQANVFGSVALGPDGRLYYGDARGRLRALDPASGQVIWTTGGFGSIRGTPVIADDGVIFFGTESGELASVDADGRERFRQRAEMDVPGSPAIGPNGDVYWGSLDGKLRRSSRGGDLRWAMMLDGPIAAAPAIGPDGTVYVGSGQSVLAVDGENGAVKWRVGAGAAVSVTPAIGADGTVFAGAENGRFLAISGGSVKWAAQTGGAIRSSAAVGSDGVVYFGSGDAIFYAYDANGQRLSTYRALDSIHGAAALDAAGTVYVGSKDNRLYAFRENARRFTESPADRLGGNLVRDPASGKVYVIVAGKRRHIPDAATQLLLGLTGSLPLALNSAEAARYAEGPALPALREGSLLRASNGPLYVLRGGKRVWIKTLEEFAAGGLSWDALVNTDDVVVRSIPLAAESGYLLKAGDDRVYLLEGGSRRWVSTQAAFESRGLEWWNVHFVSDPFLGVILDGPPLI